MQVFDRAYVEAHLTPEKCLAVMEDTIRQERAGGCTQYLRTAINMPNTNILGLMPAYFEKGYFGAKIISVYHTNAGTGYQYLGRFCFLAPDTGRCCAVWTP